MAKFIRIHDNVDSEIAINVDEIRQYSYLNHKLRVGDDDITLTRQNEIAKVEQFIDDNDV